MDSSDLTKLDDCPRFSLGVLVRVAGLFLLSRALVMTVAGLSRLAIVPGPYPHPSMSHSWIGRFLAWDAGWYVNIAERGYSYSPTTGSGIGFYPLYPLLLRTGSIFRLDPVLTGYLVSHAALAGACVLCWKLAALEFRSAAAADRTVMFLVFCPGAVWFGMVYTESLFVLTLLGCLLAARQGRWLVAGAWGLAAALTRTPGVLLSVFLFLEAAQQWLAFRRLERNAASGRPIAPGRSWTWRAAMAVMGPVLGQLGFLIFQQVRFGDWRAQQKTVANGWGTQGIRPPWTVLADRWQHADWFHTIMSDSLLGVALVAGIASFSCLRRASYGILVLALALLYTSSTTGDALPRYLCTTVPIYLVLSHYAGRSPLFETAILIFSTALLTLLTVLVVNGYIVG